MGTLPDQAVGAAHGKIILIGEHAVVYNEPAIAFPFPAAPVEVRVEKITDQSVLCSSYYSGPLQDIPESLNNIKMLIHTICRDFNQSFNGLKITIDSKIPPERGMGSSAAVATALTRALFSFYGEEIPQLELLKYVDKAETLAHGNPSGLDARVTSSYTPIYYRRGSQFTPLALTIEGYLISADTGIKGQTREAVEGVAKLLEAEPEATKEIIQTIGKLSVSAKEAIESNQIDCLGEQLTEAHFLLKKLTVSNNQLDRLVDTALEAEALGAKMTGGGRGGCMIALAKTKVQAEIIARHLMEAGAVQTWIHALGEKRHD